MEYKEKIDIRLEVIEKMDEVNAMPQITLDLMGLINEHGTSVSDIANKVKLDEALAAYILRNCNSPLYGIKTEINSIPQALTLLGLSTIKKILMSYINKNLYSISGNNEIKNELWVHSVTVAAFSEAIAGKLKINQEQAYLAGLLHDIGKLIIYSSDNTAYEEVLERIDSSENESFVIEEELLGFNHMEIGLLAMTKWKFFKDIIEVAQFHHSKKHFNKKNKYIGVIAFANLLTYQELDERLVDLSYFLKKYKLSENQLEKIILTGLELKKTYLEF